jgi:monofunctional biosynthetic peptidoglycan transglycosylase
MSGVVRKISLLFFKIVLWFIALSVATVIVYRFIPPPVTPLMLIRVTEQLRNGDQVKMKKDWVPLEEISKHLVKSVIASEDQKFGEHFGFDFEAIEKARQYNERKQGRRVKGASTISQQTAKNTFLWPDRSWIRKGFEVYFTFLIEVFWSKERIIEVYLNIIETGNGIYGAEMAAQTYFNKPAQKLTRSEAALIAACLPNPRKWSPARPTAYINRKKHWIMRQVRQMEEPVFLIKPGK